MLANKYIKMIRLGGLNEIESFRLIKEAISKNRLRLILDGEDDVCDILLLKPTSPILLDFCLACSGGGFADAGFDESFKVISTEYRDYDLCLYIEKDEYLKNIKYTI